MINILVFIALTIIGLALGVITGINPIAAPGFKLFSSIALAVGLYASVVGIDITSLGKYKKTATFIITAGVPIQIVITAAIMWIIYPHPISLLVAVAIDQIDPLSVNTLLNNKLGMSTEAKSLLRVWASFDDPVTVLVGLAFLVPVITGVATGSAATYLLGLMLNLVPAITLYLMHRRGWLQSRLVSLILLALTMGYVVLFEAFLLAAIIGLFIRPIDEAKLGRVVSVIYYLVIVVVGAAVADYGVDLRLGFLLAIVEFFVVQPLSALFMVKGTTNDIFRLAFAQQNGLTTILMGLVFQSLGFNVLPILLPAIIIINMLNLSINEYYSWKEQHGMLVTKPDQSMLQKYHKTLSVN